MTIKVSRIEEEYRYLKTNPHCCKSLTKGEWKPVQRSLTFDLIEIMQVKCENCGETATFEFDVSAAYTKEQREACKLVAKVAAKKGIHYMSGGTY